MKSSTLYRWLEWTFQPQTCTEVFPVIGLQEDNTEEITRVYTATPEIEYDKIDKVRGMDVIFVTTAKTDEEARELLTQFNMPFAK